MGRLRMVDHPMPQVSAETVIRLARPRSADAARWAAMILLSLGLASAAYAAPGSPLPRWIHTLSAWISPEPDAPIDPSPPPVPVEGSAGIAVLPGEKLAILFQLDASGAEGSVHVTLTDDSEVVVRSRSGAAGFTAGAERLEVVGRAGMNIFEVRIPRTARWVEIMVRGSRAFLKAGERVTTGAPAAPDGSYRLSLSP